MAECELAEKTSEWCPDGGGADLGLCEPAAARYLEVPAATVRGLSGDALFSAGSTIGPVWPCVRLLLMPVLFGGRPLPRPGPPPRIVLGVRLLGDASQRPLDACWLVMVCQNKFT